MSARAWYRVDGRSMWPLTAPLQVALAPVTAGELRPGDVVGLVGSRPGAGAVHRVVAVGRDHVQTRGDTNHEPDPPVPPAALLGRVVALGLGPLVLPVPTAGLPAAIVRQVGLGWGRVAPPLFVAARKLWHGTTKY